MYGGTARSGLEDVYFQGLSPRVRGNRPEPRHRARLRGSIPACTGEPGYLRTPSPPMRVYPRVYGGTPVLDPSPSPDPGLSPRVRGNRHHLRSRGPSRGSIPACTGEPASEIVQQSNGWVYPRVYGGTMATPAFRMRSAGLSPRVRGNLISLKWTDKPNGSIPACTGEPSWRRRRARPRRVYPRVYGGTVREQETGAEIPGLSPRVRGNHGHAGVSDAVGGSIPACTGEPPAPSCIRIFNWVYPRVYGGTLSAYRNLAPIAGLSPRVRGNLLPVSREFSRISKILA